MTERESFLNAVYANPDDNNVRLVFADWLDENGDPDRAEFIRLQIEAERSGDDPRTTNLRRRAARLLAANRRTWVADSDADWGVPYGYPVMRWPRPQ